MWSAAFVLSLVATVLLITSAIRTPSIEFPMALALLGVAVLFGISVTRLVATRLQDRIIRAEMVIRLGAIGRAADMRRLSMRQVVALRFASDAELPGLVDRTITENLSCRRDQEGRHRLAGGSDSRMKREVREEFLKILHAHQQTLDICEACATTTRELAAEVARGGMPAKADLVQTMEEAERVLADLAGVRQEVQRLIGEMT